MNNRLCHSIICTVFTSVIFISCSKPPASRILSPPLLAGYTSSDSIATPNLIAYWPFENNANDVIGNETGTAINVTYTKGIKGVAYQGGDSAYATVAANPAFASLASFSFSMWYKLSTQPSLYDPGGMFFLSGESNLGELIYEVEPFSPASGDSVNIHHGFNDIGSPDYQIFVMQAYDTMAIGKWMHLVTTYDGNSSTYTIYQNGVAILNNSVFGLHTGSTTMWTDNTETTPLGNLNLTADEPRNIFLGTWPPTLF